jgi:predicted nucleotidyltransferase
MPAQQDRIALAAVSPPPATPDQFIVDEIRRALEGVVAVYRFGSSAQGTAHRASDTDVAVLTHERLPAAARFDLQERLAARLGSDVDLVDLGRSSTVMAMQVIAGGQLLYEGDADARGRFEDRTYGAYARLNEERRGILERIKAEGSVYGR